MISYHAINIPVSVKHNREWFENLILDLDSQAGLTADLTSEDGEGSHIYSMEVTIYHTDREKIVAALVELGIEDAGEMVVPDPDN